MILLLSCGDGGLPDVGPDADSAVDAGADGGEPDGGSDNPLASLSDEFDGAALSGWTARNVGAGTSTLENGSLILTATTGQWHNNREHLFIYRMLEGDFVMRARVRASQVDDPSQPAQQQFNAVGVLARDPAGDVEPESWAMINIGYQAADLGPRGAFTWRGETSQQIRATFGADAELVVCRIGDDFRMFFLEPSVPDIWTPNGFYPAPQFPSQLQVGIAVDSLGLQPHLRAEVDWIRFAVPREESDCTADIPPAE